MRDISERDFVDHSFSPPDIEVTPEMIKAAAAEISFFLDEGWPREWIAERVLRAVFGKLNLPLDSL
jgi:hypothetical protein